MYEFSNKPGSLLARALRGPCTKTYISHILASSGQKLNILSDMAMEFCSFYEGLYNLDKPTTGDPSADDSITPSCI